jgi:hypothetical protein
MTRWRCPHCDREFDRAGQSHTCVPGGTVDDTFAGRPPQQRAVYDAVIAQLRTLGPVHEDAVTVGVFLRTDRKIGEVRPRSRDVLLWFYLPRPVEHPRLSRPWGGGAERVAHRLLLRAPDEVDEEVRGWLTTAYLLASDG